jgi:hypothetical protein
VRAGQGELESSDLWLCTPLLKSLGGGACTFACPPGVDPESASPPLSMLSMDPGGAPSRKKRGSTPLLEIAKKDFSELSHLDAFTRSATPEHRAAVKGWAYGNTPRAAALVRALRSGQLHEWIRSLPAENEEENYATAEEGAAPPGLVQRSVTGDAGGDASAAMARAQAVAQAQSNLTGVGKQAAANQALSGGAAPYGLERGAAPVGQIAAPMQGGVSGEMVMLNAKVDSLADSVKHVLTMVQGGRPSSSAAAHSNGWVQQLATGTPSVMPHNLASHFQAPGTGDLQRMPSAAGLTGEDGTSFGRIAKGSAGVAEIVHLMEFYPAGSKDS